MVIQNNIWRIITYKLGYLILIIIVISILSNLFAFFSRSSGEALKEKTLEVFSLDYHTPNVNWDQPKIAKGRLLEEFDNQKITKAYQNAWYFLNQSLRNKNTLGLEDFFSDHLIKEITSTIDMNQDYVEDRVDLDHNIEMHLFSIDKQVVAFKDNNVRIKRKVLKANQVIFEEEVYKSFEVVMTLADGKWRVLHMKKVENPRHRSKQNNAPIFVMDSTITFLNQTANSTASQIQINCKEKPKPGYHKLKRGETLYKLSNKYNISVEQLMKWNQIKDISDLKICSHLQVTKESVERKKIVLVTPRVAKGKKLKNRVVKKNESIFAIAQELNIEASLLRKTNNLTANELTEGQVLKVPNLIDIKKAEIEDIKGINYYPQNTPWWDFWVEFDSKIIRKDLLAIKELRMNTLRVFVPSDGVIPGLQFNVMLDKLEKFLDECHRLDLQVMITLFDFPVSFDLSYYPKSESQLKGLMERFRDHPALLGWDLKNEPDLDFDRHGKKKVIQWLSYMIERARAYDPNHILTIGWSSPEAAINLANQLDLVSYHYYRDPKFLKLDMLKLKRAVNNKPLLLQEFGLPSNKKWYYPIGYSQDAQAEYLKEFKKEMEENDLPYLLWTLYDFNVIPTQVFGYKKWANSKQKYFGLIDHKGNKKPAYDVFFR